MKLTKKTALYAAVLALAVLTGCSNVLLEKPAQGSGGELPAGEAGELPEGFGAVALTLTGGAERTVMPGITLDSLYLEYWFTGPGDGAPVEMTPGVGGIFVLEAGDYNLEALAYKEAAKQNLVARGITEEPFTVAAGVTRDVGVNLRPPASGGGTGTLAYTLKGPTGATVEILSLSRIAGDEAPIFLEPGSPSIASGLSNTKSVPAGYYLLRVVAKDSRKASAGRTAVVHIYRDLPTVISYDFNPDDFRMYRVSSAHDAGTGTLRQAIIDAQSVEGPQTIQVALEPGAVIELQTPLPEITKSLTIEGNGITLTRVESWSASATSQLLRITDTTAEVLIRRIHFKNGLATQYGGAVRTSGILTLESCIFSGNRTLSWGGAVYSNNTLTIRSCTFYNNSESSGTICFYASGRTLTLTGNLFYGNIDEDYPLVWVASGAVDASHNVVDKAFGTDDDQAGWNAGTGDTTISDLPVSPRSFKLLSGSGALGKLPAGLPADYPDTDFYGDSISGGGAAGAVQAPTAHQSGYYYVELSVSDSAKGWIDDSGQDEDGLYPAGSGITATPKGTHVFGYWLVNGHRSYGASLPISGHTWARAVFPQTLTVNSPADGSGEGTLRYALINADDDDIIVFTGVMTIELKSPLPEITKTLTIEGNGATLTRAVSWVAVDDNSQLLRITDAAAEVLIRRIHFKNGLATNYGGAVYTRGSLTLESCVFSGNRGGYSGGAVYSDNTLTIRGCTFYGNSADQGGAVMMPNYGAQTTLTLTGNLFYGNTATDNYYSVLCNANNRPVAASHNAVDKVFGTSYYLDPAGWDKGDGDTTISALPVSPLSFKLLYGSEALSMLPAGLPADYPEKDFYGNGISGGGAAGAVQVKTTRQSGYYYVELSANNSALGTVTTNPMPNEDGLVPAGVAITANPANGYAAESWLVNGARAYAASQNLSGHTWAQAIFRRLFLVTNANDTDTSGTLRYAVNHADDGDFIQVSDSVKTIALTANLNITKSLILDGNGATLTRAPSFVSNNDSQLLRVTSTTAEALVRRLHFENGLATNNGGAVRNSGILTLESCVFSGNQTTDSYAYGGAVYSENTLTVRGCTFYGNTSVYFGGAIYFYASGKPLTLTGNLFYGNTASQWSVVRNAYSSPVTASYNVVDKAFGTGNGDAGWDRGQGDKTFTELSIIGEPFNTTTFAPVAGLSSVLPSPAPEGFPDTDFNGAARTFPGAAGAVK